MVQAEAVPSNDSSQYGRLLEPEIAEVPIGQYLHWAKTVGLIRALMTPITNAQVLERTPLHIDGAVAFVRILQSLSIVVPVDDSHYQLSTSMGEQVAEGELHGGLRCAAHEWDIPESLLTEGRDPAGGADPITTGLLERLAIHRSEDFALAIHAAIVGAFASDARVDLASGPRGALPTVIERRPPPLEIALVGGQPPSLDTSIELPGRKCREEQETDLRDRLPPTSGSDIVAFGNTLCSCTDHECLSLLRQTRARLSSNGQIVIHEFTWDTTAPPALDTALRSFWLVAVAGARQRTTVEWIRLVAAAGFCHPTATLTAGGFTVIRAVNSGRIPSSDDRDIGFHAS
jgi:hypothetical protein